MKFNAEKLKAIARPMTTEEKSSIDFRWENADWLRISAAIALKIRKILKHRGLSQAELANMLSVKPAQVSKLLSGKVNFEIKTIAKLQSILGEEILTINLSEPAAERPIVAKNRAGKRVQPSSVAILPISGTSQPGGL